MKQHSHRNRPGLGQLATTAVSLGFLLLALPAHATFTLDELQRGLSEQDALSTVRNRHQVVEKLKGGDEGYVVLREAGGAVRGMFWTCQGKVHAASAIQEGGIYAFIDRVTDLGTKFGRGEVTGQLRPVERGGVSRSLETFFKAGGDAIVKLSYSPQGVGRAEAIWQQNSVPSVCTR